MRVLNQITFEAKDDAEALRLASERLGKDAVILSTRMVRRGGFMGLFQRHVLMVSAGILQDEQKEEKPKERDDVAAKERLVAFQKLLEFKQAAETRNGGGDSQEIVEPPFRQAATPEGAAKVIYSPVGVDATSNKNTQKFDSVHISSAGLASIGIDNAASRKPLPGENDTADSLKLKEEVSNLSKRLDTILQRLEGITDEPSGTAGADKNFEAGLPGISPVNLEKHGEEKHGEEKHGEMENLYQKLLSAEIESAYARQLAEEYREHKGNVPFEKWLESKVRCAADVSANALGGRKVMLLGPTGVGKTTTIAKLAAIQALWEHKNVFLLTSDTYRIAAVDQLRTYAKILGVPMEVIFEVENFANILDDHADADLILLDTAGRGQRDRKSLEILEVIHDVFKPDAVHLVLAANMKYRDMLDVVERMSVVPISHVIFTKLDETVSYGAIFNVLKSLDCPVSFFTTGQNVPNDIEVASSGRLAGLLVSDEGRRNTL
ncbi:MAG: flagellar biosynthesis protein FlhF [Synergistaceae bacterium]|jgi:flagellar biosynthesis protein FlhF|nr:flagellar biosynthesis protein FlhF [Synergistaceae bacterium]